MASIQIYTNTIVFLLGIVGIFYNHKSIVIILMCIELILLSVNLNFLVFSVHMDDLTGQIISLFVLTVTAAESAIGLAILILYYRIRGNISIVQEVAVKG